MQKSFDRTRAAPEVPYKLDFMLLRNAFLYLSQQKQLRRWMESSRFARPLTARFISGTTLEDAMRVASQLREGGIHTALDRLGENVTTPEEARIATEAYLQALERIEKSGSGATVSGKLTQFGLDLSERLCLENTARIASRACRGGSRFEVDMEDSRYTERTIDVVRQLQKSSGSIRAVIQAYLYRSEEDVNLLNRERIPVRLCKGAYNEPRSVAFQQKEQVDANFLLLSESLFARGAYPAIATHDPRMLEASRKYARKYGVAEDQFEFQMLYGIRRDLQQQLVREGYQLRLYVPYGEAWYPYFMRRLAERPANVFFLARNLLRS
jgi:proline dehydrogenase